MNEEWYNDNIQTAFHANWSGHYGVWLAKLIDSQLPTLTAKDKTFSQFLLDLPKIPSNVLNTLRELCLDPDRMPIGFHTLRDVVVLRPPLRAEAMNILLELTTHPERVARTAAINTVKRWVPDVKPMDDLIRTFALQMLRRLETNRQDESMEPGAQESIQTQYIPENLELPAPQLIVLQHVELLFALTIKVPDFLDAIFAAYGQMDHSVQDAIQHLITALIRSLGSNHGKLLTVLRTFPPAAESLALRVATILTENGRPSAQLVAIVKGLTAERALDARFLIPIIAEMDKADIVKHLPRIVARLNGTQEERNVVKSVFSSIVTTPPQGFGSVSSNLPRVRQSELLTPAELLVLLHESEKEIGLKSAMEAIGICFSMTDVYRSEILAVVMQQIVDHATLPTLFMRTVIQAVTTYKSLIGYVSGTLLSRLITKKIWMNPPLWDGFIRCAKAIAPTSFGALLQLPKEQLREIVENHPSLKSGLREYVIKKAGSKARVTSFLEVFGEDSSSGSKSPTPQPVSLPG
jgi:symplekin